MGIKSKDYFFESASERRFSYVRNGSFGFSIASGLSFGVSGLPALIGEELSNHLLNLAGFIGGVSAAFGVAGFAIGAISRYFARQETEKQIRGLQRNLFVYLLDFRTYLVNAETEYLKGNQHGKSAAISRAHELCAQLGLEFQTLSILAQMDIDPKILEAMEKLRNSVPVEVMTMFLAGAHIKDILKMAKKLPADKLEAIGGYGKLGVYLALLNELTAGPIEAITVAMVNSKAECVLYDKPETRRQMVTGFLKEFTQGMLNSWGILTFIATLKKVSIIAMVGGFAPWALGLVIVAAIVVGVGYAIAMRREQNMLVDRGGVAAMLKAAATTTQTGTINVMVNDRAADQEQIKTLRAQLAAAQAGDEKHAGASSPFPRSPSQPSPQYPTRAVTNVVQDGLSLTGSATPAPTPGHSASLQPTLIPVAQV
ncbi:hypothetical protein BH10PSE19_BH10PSE19_19620 [soil metagenome]